jgi:hypothetical protein
MRLVASTILAASLALASAASAANIELICRGTASSDGHKDQRVRFHLRLDPTARTFCFGDCHERLRFTSASDGVYRYEATASDLKTFEVRLQPAIDYRADYHTGETRSHEDGHCRNALVRDLIAAITRPTSEPWPDPR